MDQTKNQINKDIRGDKRISIAIMSSFAILTIQYLILYYFNLTGSTLENIVQISSKIIVGFLFLLGLPSVLRRNWVLFIVTYTISIGIFLYNYLIFSQNVEFIKNLIFPFFFTCLPSFVYSYSIKDRKIFIDIMEKTSIVVFIVGILLGTLVFSKKMFVGGYSMSLSYYMLLPTIISLNRFLKTKSLTALTAFIMSFIVIIALGSRGPIMCIGIFILIYLINNIPKLNYKVLLLYSFLSTIFIMIIMNIEKVLLYVYNLLLDFGITSRTLLLFMRKDIYLSGRENLYKEIMFQILEKPILGIGIAGDRLHIGTYTHNIFVELLSGFGIIGGSLIIILLVWITFKSIKQDNKNGSNFMGIWISLGLAPLFISGSYLIDFHFWIFLGFGLKSIIKRHDINKTKIL